GTIRSEDALRHAAQIICATVRKADIVTRYDSQTFAMILPHTGASIEVAQARLLELLGAWIADEGLDRGRAPIQLVAGNAFTSGESLSATELIAGAVEAMESAQTELPLAA